MICTNIFWLHHAHMIFFLRAGHARTLCLCLGGETLVIPSSIRHETWPSYVRATWALRNVMREQPRSCIGL